MKKMSSWKKLMMAVAAILTLMVCAMPFAMAAGTATDWYELSGDGAVLTVRLPGNTKTGLTWSFEIENPADLELLTHETIVGESEGMAGAPTTYVASFRAKDNIANTACLILRCGLEGENPEYIRVMQLNTTADNKLEITSITEKAPFAEWCEYDFENDVMTTRLTGADWTFEMTQPACLDLINSDDSDGSYVASFKGLSAGEGDLMFASDDGLKTRGVNAFVSENSEITINYVTSTDIIVKTEEEPQTSYFQTVAITGTSVNMRAGTSTSTDVITVLKKDMSAKYTGVTRTAEDGSEWHQIIHKDKTGWVSAKYSKIGGAGYVKIINGDSNIRSLPTVESDIITAQKKGSIIKFQGEGMTDERGVDWYKVQVDKKTGWVSSKYAEFSTGAAPVTPTKTYKYVKIVNGDCTLRKSANRNSDSLTTLSEGTTVNYLNEQATDERGVAWYKVNDGKRTGWVSSKLAKLTNTKGSSDTDTDDSDMRLVLNPNRYDVLCVTDIYSQNGRDYYVEGCFGKIKNGEPTKFDHRKTVRMPLVYGAEVLLPEDLDEPFNIDYVNDPAIWFNDARNHFGGGSFNFYASFSMNESGALRNLVYIYLD